MPSPEIYLSTDCETDGPIPGLKSMPRFAIGQGALFCNMLAENLKRSDIGGMS